MFNRLTSTGIKITDANLYGGVTYNIDINPDNDFMYGCVTCASIEFTIDNSDGKASELMGKTFDWYCQFESNSFLIKKGSFKVAEIKKTKDKATITAYDKVYDLEANADSWLASLTFPMTLKELTDSMATK